MQWIWSFEELARVCRFKKVDPDRLAWSVERLATLYPEQAGDLLIEIVERGESEAAEEALIFFEKNPDLQYTQRLRDSFLNSSGKLAGRIAEILKNRDDREIYSLFKQKYPGPFEENVKTDLEGYLFSLSILSELKTDAIKEDVETIFNNLSEPSLAYIGLVFSANLEAGNSLSHLLKVHADKSEFHSGYGELLEIIGNHCLVFLDIKGISMVDEFISGDGTGETPPQIEHVVKLINHAGQSEWWKEKASPMDLLKKHQYKELVDSIGQAVEAIIAAKRKHRGEENYKQWEESAGDGVVNTLDSLKAIAEVFPRLPETAVSQYAYGELLLFLSIVDFVSVIGIDLKQMPVSEYRSVFFEDRPTIPGDADGVAAIKSSGQMDGMVDECFEKLDESPYRSASIRIVRFLCGFRKPEYIERLLEMDFDKQGVWDELSRGLLGLEPGEALKLIAAFLEKDERKNQPVLSVLRAMADLPSDETVRLLLKHWTWLFSMDQAYFLMVISSIADKRFLKPLKEETFEYCELEWETYDKICRVSGIKDSWVKSFGKKIKAFRRDKSSSAKLLMEDNALEVLEKPVYLDLRCRSCNRVYTYKVAKIHFVPETLDILIHDGILCRWCGVFDDYRLTPMVADVIMPLLGVYMEAVTESTDRAGLVVEPIMASSEEGEVMSQQAFMESHLAKLVKTPDDPALLVGYGNALRNAKCTEDSIEYYKKALHYDPDAVEGYLNLGQIEEEKGNLQNAYDYYWKVAEIIHTGNYYVLVQDFNQFKISVAHIITHVSESLRKPVHPDIMDIMEIAHMQ